MKRKLVISLFCIGFILCTSIASAHVLTDSLSPGMIDTATYKDLPFWTAAMDTTADQFDTKFIDTFSVGGNKFRFVNYIGQITFDGEPIYLEKLIDGKWTVTDFSFGTGNLLGTFYHNRDVNGDGYNDITRNENFDQQVFFYYPQSKDNYNFDSMIYINPEWQLIDTANHIFCDFREYKRLSGQIISTLYTFDNFQKRKLYELELYNPNDYNPNLIIKFILYKVTKDNEDAEPYSMKSDLLKKIKVIKLTKPINLDNYDGYNDESYFDYVNFWKENYKKLLNIPQKNHP